MTEINENIVDMTEVVIDDAKLAQIVEAALMVAGRLLSMEDLLGLFEDHERPPVTSVQKALERIAVECTLRGIELKETASGFRFQAKQEHSLYLSRLWDEKPKRYSRSLLETLALIAYRQPITRGEIEEIRGVACNSDIFKSLMERDWIRIVGHRDVPGRPALYATTRHFLDYFNMKSLDQLPSLAAIKDLDSLNVEINFEEARRSIQEAASGALTIEEASNESLPAVKIALATDEEVHNPDAEQNDSAAEKQASDSAHGDDASGENSRHAEEQNEEQNDAAQTDAAITESTSVH